MTADNVEVSEDLSTLPSNPVPIYVINLDRSVNRLEGLARSASRADLSFTRVKGVDGVQVPHVERKELNELLFGLRCGRRSLPGEYGCYRSHLDTLDRVAEASDEVALIMEDDLEFPENFRDMISGLTPMMEGYRIIKLVNHRSGGFLKLWQAGPDCEIGVCTMGPQGSSAAYLVTRKGARRLRQQLSNISLPYDTAFERAWATGVSVLTVRTNLMPYAGGERGETLVGTSLDYRATKFFKLLRVPSYLFKGLENVLRAGNACFTFLLWKWKA